MVPAAFPCHASRATRHRAHGQQGIALIITLIMLAITLVMAVAFLALAQHERRSVTTNTDTVVAHQAADSALAAAEGQIVANILSSFTNNNSSNAYNLHLLVSTNLINPVGFSRAQYPLSGNPNPTNVNYDNANGSVPDWNQNIANLWILPRAPVFIPTNTSQNPVGYDFRYYLDLNENGKFETNGMQAVSAYDKNTGLHYFGTDGTPIAPADVRAPNILSNFFVGDPEWVGMLAHPDSPHGPNNQFVSRYAFIALPAGNALDLNYIHNQAQNFTSPNASDYYMRNQGVGSWEINLAAFLADLNTNGLVNANGLYGWGAAVGSGTFLQPNSVSYYQYNEPTRPNRGIAFDDARALLAYRYNFNPLGRQDFALANSTLSIPVSGIDTFSSGPLQTTLDTNENYYTWGTLDTKVSWSGSDNTNHFFTPSDFFDLSKTTLGVKPQAVKAGNDFTGRLKNAGSLADTYDRYTYYRMLDQLASDSTPLDGRLNLNYSNAIVRYAAAGNGIYMPTNISIVAGAETNLVRWNALDFFTAASDQMLRTYTAYWYGQNYVAFTNTYGVTAPFSITNIPVWVSNRFVYTPAVNRLLQLAANLYDATTNGNNNLPHVFRPLFKRVQNGTNNDIYVIGYTPVTYVTGADDVQLQKPRDVTELLTATTIPILDNRTGATAPVNVYGVPWIFGAKKGLPNFNQLNLVNAATVSRKLELTRTTLDPRKAVYGTNQMYIFGISNSLGVTFWNSYNASYPRPVRVYASDILSVTLTNGANLYSNYIYTFANNTQVDSWPGSQMGGQHPASLANPKSFLSFPWSDTFMLPMAYNFGTGKFDADAQWQTTSPQLPQLPQFGLLITNYCQAYILDGNNVIDYVEFRDPIDVSGLNQALADPDYPQPDNVFLQWSTNAYNSVNMPYGVENQLYVSGHYKNAPPYGGQWKAAPTPMGVVSPDAEAAYFGGFFTPSFYYDGTGKNYVNRELVMQAPYTPTRTVYSSYLLQANDPLVHYTSSDLNAQPGTMGVWANGKFVNGVWHQSDDPVSQPLPVSAASPIQGQFQPWGASGQMGALGAFVDKNPYNLAYKDPLVWEPDNWDFPTNLYPTVGWIGRVHRGTPWQTVYLKSSNILSASIVINTAGNPNVGYATWANWTGDIQTNYYSYYFDSLNAAPQQDYLLFDIFTARLNDNAVRGSLPVNAGMNRPDGGVAAWSALFSGMVALTNNLFKVFPSTPLTYDYLTVSPAGVDLAASPLWQIVNGPFGIAATRTNITMFPFQSFTHVGQILATPALSVASPFLSTNSFGSTTRNPSAYQIQYGINDEEYEWLPQQMMGLVRGTEQRFVVYGFGQTLRPAPGGTVLSSAYFQMVTNYQVVAESAVRAVIRVDNANTATPRAVVETYNVMPPN